MYKKYNTGTLALLIDKPGDLQLRETRLGALTNSKSRIGTLKADKQCFALQQATGIIAGIGV